MKKDKTAKVILQKHLKNVVYGFNGDIIGDVNANDIVKAMEEYADIKACDDSIRLIHLLGWFAFVLMAIGSVSLLFSIVTAIICGFIGVIILVVAFALKSN